MSGALLYVYEVGTTTEVTTYSDIALTSANPHPVVADAAGSWGDIYVPTGTYKIDVTNPTVTSLAGYPIDNVDVFNFVGTLGLDTRAEVETVSVGPAGWSKAHGGVAEERKLAQPFAGQPRGA